MKIAQSNLKIWALIALGVLLVVILAPIKQLTFIGLSHCGRVFSEIQAEESNIEFFLSVTGESTRFSVNDGSVLDLARQEIPQNFEIIWTIGVNNPSCFSNSQKAYLSQFQEEAFRQTVYRDAGLMGCRSGGCYKDFYVGRYVPLSKK
jgi:hypothetical protein